MLWEAQDSVIGINDQYSFALSRPKAGGEWFIVMFGREDRVKIFDKNAQPIRKVFSPQTILGDEADRSLYLFSNNKTIFTNSRSGGGDLLSTDFSVSDGAAFGRTDIPLLGTVTFYPARNYLVTEFNTTFKNTPPPSYRYTAKRELLDGTKFPRVKSLTCTYSDPTTGKVSQTERLEFSEYQDTPPAAKEFTLEHYGVPVPADENASPRWPIWTAIGVAGIVVVALIRWRVVRRRNA
jgi:hypothetical protein